MADKKTFDMGAFLNDHGMQLSGVGDDGSYKVKAPDGTEKTLDTQSLLKDIGVNSKAVNLQFNTPDAPLDVSPVGLADRAKLALGNTRGSIGYLKTKFDDAAVSEKSGLVVKNKGVWQKVDQDHFDPWELTKDVVEGAISFVPSAVAATVGSTAGATVGLAAGPAGAIAGGLAGAGAGGAVAESARTSLGRLAGTYQATPEEQLKDIGYEFLLNAGGQAVGYAVKPTVSMLGKAVKDIVRKAAPAAIDTMSEVLGRTTGAGTVNTRTLFDQTDEVVNALGTAKSGALSQNDVLLNLKNRQMKAVDQLVNEAPQALTKRFGELKDTLVSAVDDKFTTNVGDVIRGAQNSLVDGGFGKWVSKGGKNPTFELLTDNDFARRMSEGLSVPNLDKASRSAIEDALESVNKYTNIGELKGKQAASVLMELKRSVNSTMDSLWDSATPTTQKFLGDVKKSIGERIGEQFHNAGVGEQYAATSNLYGKFADSVNYARKVAGSDNGSEALLNKLVSGIGANRTYKDFTQDMAQLLGKRGEDILNSVKVDEAAKSFAPIFPRSSLGSLTVGAAAGGAAATGMLTAPVAAIGASMTSPRAVMKQVQYGQKALEFMKGLSPAARAQWLQNPDVVRETFKTVVEPAHNEDDATEQLLQQAGVKGQQQ